MAIMKNSGVKKWLFRGAVLVVVGVGLVYGGILLWTKVIDPPEDRFDSDDLAAVVDVTTTVADSSGSTTIPTPDGDELSGLWMVTDGSEVGYRVKEVLGGVDTEGLSSRTMMAKAVPGLFFVGECVDVTGWLGGYNFQWAWASGVAAGLSF
jgi:hypothetical protein